jgi:hypothetical protein
VCSLLFASVPEVTWGRLHQTWPWRAALGRWWGGGTTGQHGASSGLFHTLSLGAHNSPVKAGSISPHADVKYG